jgi:hypothetical protein
MRKPILILGVAGAFAASPSLAQVAGPLAGPAPNISNSDMATHDSFSNPDLHDQLVNYRQRELSDRVRAEGQGLGPSRQAKKSELTAGAAINDKTGVPIAHVDAVDPDGVIVTTGTKKVKLPADAFGHNKAGLLLDTTKADFEKMIASAS